MSVHASASEPMAALDHLRHRGEASPHTRSSALSVEYLACIPDWDRLLAVFERASRSIARLRQKVVVPILPTVSASWVVDPDFDIDYHVRRTALPAPGSHRQVLDLANRMLQAPLDAARPLWEVTLVEGVAGGGAVLLTKMSHAVTGGLGAVALFEEIYDFEAEPGPRPWPPLPAAADVSPADLTRAGLRSLPRSTMSLVRGTTRFTARVLRVPVAAVAGGADFALSAGRVVRGATTERSPLLRRRSLTSRIVTLDVPLADLERAGRAGGGSVDDAYLAAVCAGLRRYHDKLGVQVDTVPMAVPVPLRSRDDGAGGQHFAGVVLAAPVAETDTAKQIAGIRRQVAAVEAERAIDVFGVLAPALARLPGPLLDVVAGTMPAPDVQASSLGSCVKTTYIAGAQVERHYPIGPLPGVALMIVLVSRGDTCFVGARYDTAAISDDEVFADCLQAGFDEIAGCGLGTTS